MTDFDTFFAPVDDFLNRLRRRGLSPATQKAYARDLGELRDLAEKSGETAPDRRFFVAALKRLSARNLNPRTLARKLSVWRTYVRYLIESGILKENPASGIKAPKPPLRLPKAVDAEELNRLLDAPVPDNFLTRRDRAVFELLYGSGLRVAEAAGLNVSDIDLGEGWVKVRGKGDKERRLPLGGKSMEALRLYLPMRRAKSGENALFLNRNGSRLGVRRINQTLDAWARRLDADRHLSPHMLRHSFASEMLQSTHDIRAVQELLGHARLSTTQIYTKIDFAGLARAYDLAHPRAKKK